MDAQYLKCPPKGSVSYMFQLAGNGTGRQTEANATVFCQNNHSTRDSPPHKVVVVVVMLLHRRHTSPSRPAVAPKLPKKHTFFPFPSPPRCLTKCADAITTTTTTEFTTPKVAQIEPLSHIRRVGRSDEIAVVVVIPTATANGAASSGLPYNIVQFRTVAAAAAYIAQPARTSAVPILTPSYPAGQVRPVHCTASDEPAGAVTVTVTVAKARCQQPLSGTLDAGVARRKRLHCASPVETHLREHVYIGQRVPRCRGGRGRGRRRGCRRRRRRSRRSDFVH